MPLGGPVTPSRRVHEAFDLSAERLCSLIRIAPRKVRLRSSGHAPPRDANRLPHALGESLPQQPAQMLPCVSAARHKNARLDLPQEEVERIGRAVLQREVS